MLDPEGGPRRLLKSEMPWRGPTLGPKARESGVRKVRSAVEDGEVEERPRMKGDGFSGDRKGFRAI